MVLFIQVKGIPQNTECSNLNATIKIDFSAKEVVILTSMSPEATFETLKLTDLIFSKSTFEVQTPESARGNTKRTIVFLDLSIEKKDHSSMPNAYNRLAEEDGSINDYFICSKNHAWLSH